MGFLGNQLDQKKPLSLSPALCCLDRTFEIAISAAHYVFNVVCISRGEPHQPINEHSFLKITNHQYIRTPLHISAIDTLGEWAAENGMKIPLKVRQ